MQSKKQRGEILKLTDWESQVIPTYFSPSRHPPIFLNQFDKQQTSQVSPSFSLVNTERKSNTNLIFPIIT